MLKPCPFCGSGQIDLDIAIREDNDRCPRPHRVYEIECLDCSVRMEEWSQTWWGSMSEMHGRGQTEQDLAAMEAVIGRWNTRV